MTTSHSVRGGRVSHLSGGSEVGSLSATLKGSGTGTLTFSNCYVSGNVTLYLNDVLLASAGKGETLSETFSYSNNDELRLTENYAVIQLKHLEFQCEYLVSFTHVKGRHVKIKSSERA